MGVFMGKVHDVLRALIDKGLVKISNFRRSNNERTYLYKFTSAGMSETVRITRRYLVRRVKQYEYIRAQIEGLRAQLAGRHESVEDE